MALWHFLALQCTEWPYDISLLSSAKNGLMTCPCCPMHRMTLWDVHAVECTKLALCLVHAAQCTEWPYDMSMMSSAQDGLMTCPCCTVHRMALWHVHADQWTEWPYDMSMLLSAHNWPYALSMLSSAQNGLMTFPCCSMHRMALWHFLAVQCTEWPYDIFLLFGVQNSLMTCPCSSVHRMTLRHYHAVQYTEWPYDMSMQLCVISNAWIKSCDQWISLLLPFTQRQSEFCVFCERDLKQV
jgi:hypothetical protein